MKSGSWVILSLVIVAAIAAVFVVWWRKSTVDDLMREIGPARIATMETSPQVQLLILASQPPGVATDDQEIMIASRPYRVAGSRDLSAQPELIHMRHAFATDVSYQWGRKTEGLTADADTANWVAAIQFGKGEETTTLAIAPTASLVYVVETNTVLDARNIGKALQEFQSTYVKE